MVTVYVLKLHTHFTAYMQIYTSVYLEWYTVVCTKTVDSVFRSLWLATQTRDLQCYSPMHLQLLRESHAELACVTSKMASWFAQIHEEGDEIWFGSFNR